MNYNIGINKTHAQQQNKTKLMINNIGKNKLMRNNKQN